MNAQIHTNGTEPTEAEQTAVERMAERLNATLVSLYRTSEGLRAYVIDGGGGEHIGVPVVPGGEP